MSLLVVEKVTHGFGARQILEDASFRLLKGEHIGLVGANGEGKSTFLNIITGKIMPDAGNITWSRHVTVGYLDQHSVLKNYSENAENYCTRKQESAHCSDETPDFLPLACSDISCDKHLTCIGKAH